MTNVIRARNVNHAFVDGWWLLRTEGIKEQSRNGPVLVMPGPVITEYSLPHERVLFNAKRDANPVFHLMESLWMLAGEDDIRWLKQFNTRIETYADDNGRVWGAYGARWAAGNQLSRIVQVLKKDPDSRQAVLQMWNSELDLGTQHRDRPCNTSVYFDLRGQQLNMTVTCRSNDMLWGAYGANAVHFSILQEVLAHELSVPVGVYRQVSNNFHVYTDLPMVKEFLEQPPTHPYDPYYANPRFMVPLLHGNETMKDLHKDCWGLCNGAAEPMHTVFMRTVAQPLAEAYLARKNGHMEKCDSLMKAIPHCDWKQAFTEWKGRRDDSK